MKNWLLTTEQKTPDYYKGLLIHADTGMHEQALALLRQYIPPKSRVLDVGAGAGAFSLRLQDAGYEVSAVDMDKQEWQALQVPFHQLDVDKGLSAYFNEPFDAVCCLEVIEHLENQWQLLREIYALLKPGGRLLLSTPNISSFLSRLIFLRRGIFFQFDDGALLYGHIHPITAHELTWMAESTGWKILESRPGGYLPVFDLSQRHPKMLLLNLLRGLVYWLAKGEKRGWCLFWMLEKPA